MSSDRTKQICLWMTIYICSPTPVGLSSLANEVIVLPLAYMRGSSYESSSRLLSSGNM